jgi:hypothetical protein
VCQKWDKKGHSGLMCVKIGTKGDIVGQSVSKVGQREHSGLKCVKRGTKWDIMD